VGVGAVSLLVPGKDGARVGGAWRDADRGCPSRYRYRKRGWAATSFRRARPGQLGRRARSCRASTEPTDRARYLIKRRLSVLLAALVSQEKRPTASNCVFAVNTSPATCESLLLRCCEPTNRRRIVNVSSAATGNRFTDVM